MQPNVARTNIWRNAALLLFALACTLGGLYWYAGRPGVSYLSQDRRADWIVYPQPSWYIGHRVAELDTDFRRSFTLKHVPEAAQLELKAFRRATVQLNGQILPGLDGEDWRQLQSCDIHALLVQGENTLFVTVSNDIGPPALWLNISVDGQTIVASDSRWEASYAGAIWQAARSADRQVYVAKIGIPLPRVRSLLQSQWVRLATFALLGCLGWFGLEYWLARRDAGRPADEPARGLDSRETLAAAIVIVTCWLLIFAHNAPWIAAGTGFDSFWHKQYINYLQQRGELPPADAGAQMHQPPLYYAVAAIVLSVTRQTIHTPTGVVVLRGLSAVLGAAHVVFIFLSLRVLFPTSVPRQLAGLTVAAFLPVHLFIFQYATNETLMTTLASASVFATLYVLSSRRPTWWSLCTLAILLGAALLTKLTAVVLVMAVLFTLAIVWVWPLKQMSAIQLSGAGTALRLSVVVGLMLLVGGGHYLRMYRNYGTPFPRQVEHLGSTSTWVAPGYRTGAHFWQFGRALERPYFAGLDSFPDAIYSTCWGDGRLAGSGRRNVLPPWNLDLMTLGYVLALVPTILIALGALATVWRWIVRPDAGSALILSLIVLMATALVFENIRHPHLTLAKAWYGLPAATAVCALAGHGAALRSSGSWWLRGLTFPALFTWAIVVGASFWINTGSVEVQLRKAAKQLQRERMNRALPILREVIADHPRNAEAYFLLGTLLQMNAQHDQARQAFAAAVSLNPEDAIARQALATALSNLHQNTEAEEQCAKAIELAPDLRDAYLLQSVLRNNDGRLVEALESARQGLRLQPSQIELHAIAARAYRIELEDLWQARRHCRYALAIDGEYLPALEEIARIEFAEGRAEEAIGWLRRAIATNAALPRVYDYAAWLAATVPDVALRDPQSALTWAKRACSSATARQRPFYLRTLAAAYAADGRFERAVETVGEAMQLAELAGESTLLGELREDRMLYSQGRPRVEPFVGPSQQHGRSSDVGDQDGLRE